MSTGNSVVHTFGPDYDAKLSTGNAMDQVRHLMDVITTMLPAPADQVQVQIAAAQLWVGVAQVHATAALTLATEAKTAPSQAKKMCRCP